MQTSPIGGLWKLPAACREPRLNRICAGIADVAGGRIISPQPRDRSFGHSWRQASWQAGLIRMAEAVFKEVPGGHLWHWPASLAVWASPISTSSPKRKRPPSSNAFAGSSAFSFPLLIVGNSSDRRARCSVHLFQIELDPDIHPRNCASARAGRVAIPHVYLMRLLAPIMIGLPKTDQRITQREIPSEARRVHADLGADHRSVRRRCTWLLGRTGGRVVARVARATRWIQSGIQRGLWRRHARPTSSTS